MGSVEFDESRITISGVCGFVLLIAVPFHILLIVVLVRYRNANDFRFPFFKMLLSLSINDLLVTLFLSPCFLMVLFPKEIVVQYGNPWNNIIVEGVFGGGLAGDTVILVAIGLNRLVSYVFPLQMIWYPFHTKCVIVLQWLYSVSLTFTYVHPDLHGTLYLNETTGALMKMMPETLAFQLRAVLSTILNILAGVTLVFVYSVCVGKLLYQKMVTTIPHGGSESLAIEARLTCQGLFLSCSIILGTVLYAYAILIGFSLSPVFFALLVIVSISNFVLGPFIAIGMSSKIRKHVKKLFGINDNVVHVLPCPNNLVNA